MLRFALIVAVSLSAGAGLAQSLPCGAPYEVRPGDTLQRIAERAYGPEASYRSLWDANRERLGGRDPSTIAVGQVIDVPCIGADGRPAPDAALTQIETAALVPPPPAAPEPAAAPATAPQAAEAEAPQAAQAEAPQAAETTGDAAADTGANWPSLPARAAGMMQEIVAAALARAPGAAALGLGPAGGGAATADAPATRRFRLSYPWPEPDCGDVARLGADSRAQCLAWRWSDPIYETVVAYLTRADAPAPATPAALRGLRLCRPAYLPDAVLEARGLTPPDVALSMGATPEDCLEALAAGAADVVAMDAGAVGATLARLGLGDRVAERPALAQVVTLHAVAPADNPDAAIALAALNEGLEDLRDSGAWFDIVSGALRTN
jgi:nucleoid-associated protein YgaU